MENSKLSQLLSKLSAIASNDENSDFNILDDKCDYLKGISGGTNNTCTNGTCMPSTNGTCTNTVCTGSNGTCKKPEQ
jgi:hypothetical protein